MVAGLEYSELFTYERSVTVSEVPLLVSLSAHIHERYIDPESSRIIRILGGRALPPGSSGWLGNEVAACNGSPNNVVSAELPAAPMTRSRADFRDRKDFVEVMGGSTSPCREHGETPSR